MSPERTEYYREKQRKMAFYIVDNENNDEENPPTVSAIIGLDQELEVTYLSSRRPPYEKNPSMNTGITINRDIISHNKKLIPENKPTINKNRIHCPSIPSLWRNNLDLIIPKAELGQYSSNV